MRSLLKTAGANASPFARAGLTALLLLLPQLAEGQTVWDNGNGNNRWGTANNWNPNAVPGAGTNVQFNATDDNATVSNIQLRGNFSANSITFNNVDDNFSIINGTGSRTLTLTSGDITRTAGSSGTQSLAMTTLTLGGDAAMNIAGSGSLTISSVINESGGARALTTSGAGELILSAANTFSGGVTVSAGTLTLSNASALGTGNLTLSGGTLRLNAVGVTLGTLNVTGNSTIDFTGVSTLSLTNFSISGGVTLNIINWAAASDFFYTANWSGATYDTMGSAPMNQVIFSGYTASETGWDSWDNQIRPRVPEPSTYGAMLLTALAGFFGWRRRRQLRGKR
jgi:autotransporter-associated beta strand protein